MLEELDIDNTGSVGLDDFLRWVLGKTSIEKKRFLSGIARMMGGRGSTHARIFWPFFKKCIFGQ